MILVLWPCAAGFREPRGDFVCVDAKTLVGPTGAGLSISRLFDRAGLFGVSTQSLQIRPR